jgi:hypothetical protein
VNQAAVVNAHLLEGLELYLAGILFQRYGPSAECRIDFLMGLDIHGITSQENSCPPASPEIMNFQMSTRRCENWTAGAKESSPCAAERKSLWDRNEQRRSE